MKKFYIVERYDESSKTFAKKLKEKLESVGQSYDEQNADVVFVIGGDGTFLKAIHEHWELVEKASFVGLHTGTLGFFSDFTDQEFDDFVNAYLKETPKVIEYQLLEVQTNKGDVYYALNEARIENITRTLKVKVSVNGHFFEHYAGTGLCVCTQLGSTAYNHSLKGAVIEEGLPLIQMSEIAGIHNRIYRSLGSSIVLNEKAKIHFESENFEDTKLCVDHLLYSIDDCASVDISLSDKRVKVLRYKEVSYFERLKNLF